MTKDKRVYVVELSVPIVVHCSDWETVDGLENEDALQNFLSDLAHARYIQIGGKEIVKRDVVKWYRLNDI